MAIIGNLFFYLICFLFVAAMTSNIWTILKAVHMIYTAFKKDK
jgi:hypothetical protein